MRKRLPSRDSPSYGYIYKRINRLDVDNKKRVKIKDDDYVIFSINNAGIKITNRGQWMEEKWNVQNKNVKKGYLKIHIPLDIDQRNPCSGCNR